MAYPKSEHVLSGKILMPLPLREDGAISIITLNPKLENVQGYIRQTTVTDLQGMNGSSVWHKPTWHGDPRSVMGLTSCTPKHFSCWKLWLQATYGENYAVTKRVWPWHQNLSVTQTYVQSQRSVAEVWWQLYIHGTAKRKRRIALQTEVSSKEFVIVTNVHVQKW